MSAGQRPYSSQPGDEVDYFDWPASINKPRHERRKPMIRIVCPICAAMIMVNALDVAGATDSHCSKCPSTLITIETDDEGRIIGIAGFDNAEGKLKARKPPDWKILAGVAAALLALIMFVLMFNAARPPRAGRTSPNATRDDAGLVSPALAPEPAPSLPAPSSKVNPATPDMFAPSQK